MAHESKAELDARGLKTAFNSLVSAAKNVDTNYLGIRNILKEVVEPCVKNHAKNPSFPVREFQGHINNLREAVETRNVHKVHECREILESLFSGWAKKSSDIIVGS